MKNEIIFKTKIGNMFVEADDFFVTCIDFTTQDIARQYNPILHKAKKQILEYLEGSRKKFDLPIKLIGTDFQKKVWKALLTIPYGRTACYEDIAKRIKMPKAVRAVASAIRKNPMAIVYPCHRVIRKNGEIGKYAGGARLKKRLLKLESTSTSS